MEALFEFIFEVILEITAEAAGDAADRAAEKSGLSKKRKKLLIRLFKAAVVILASSVIFGVVMILGCEPDESTIRTAGILMAVIPLGIVAATVALTAILRGVKRKKAGNHNKKDVKP